MILIISNNLRLETSKRTKALIKVVKSLGYKVYVLSQRDSIEPVLKMKHLFKGIIIGGSSLRLSEPLNIEFIKNTISIFVYFKHLPILGICFGFQIMSIIYGGKVTKLTTPQKGIGKITVKKSHLFDAKTYKIYKFHYDHVLKAPLNFKITGKYKNMIYSIENKKMKKYGVQFHPEMLEETHSIIENFLK